MILPLVINKVKSLLKRDSQHFEKYAPSFEPPKSGMDKETIREKIREVPFWWHYIELGHGVVTPGHQGGVNNPEGTRNVLRRLNLPEDLLSKTILDIGAWDGFFSFEAEKRNACRVVAIDNFYRLEKEGKNLERSQFGFKVAKEILGSNVEYKEMDVLDLCPESIGAFDIVLFLGVLYHVKYPLLALERVASVTKEMMILESHCVDIMAKKPVAVFYPNNELNGDPTSWWGLNQTCMEIMVRIAGFRTVKCVSKVGDRIVLHAFK